MNRRAFLGALGAAAAGLTVTSLLPDDLDRLLWVPGRKTIFLPPPPPALVITDTMAEAIAHPVRGLLMADWVTKEALAVLKRNLAFSALVNREYDESYINRQSLGRPIRVHLPARFA